MGVSDAYGRFCESDNTKFAPSISIAIADAIGLVETGENAGNVRLALG